MRGVLKFIITCFVLVLLWQGVVIIFEFPHYILPKPIDVLHQLITHKSMLFIHTKTTMLEIFLGIIFSFIFGLGSAFLLIYFKRLSNFFLPILVVSQAIPVFAIAPILVLWLGYGLASKIAMTIIIVYFPITTACYDGLKNTPQNWLFLAKIYNLTPLETLLKVRFKASLPSLTSGLKIAVCIAPIGAVIGEWVGSSKGLGYLMLHANARMQVDLMFAALFILMGLTLSLYFLTDFLTKKLTPWASHVS